MKLVHCSYHKCLTVYFSKVFSNLYNRAFKLSSGYKHFNSFVDDLYEHVDEYRVASINNHSLDLQRLGNDVRVSRLVRDPRDLIISGYFYHRRGAEAWCNIVDPKEEDWKTVNGNLPSNLPKGHSFASYLQACSTEEGLIAEIEFRKHHFDSMKMWPTSDSRVKVFRYEDMMANERQVFEDIFSFYEVPWVEKQVGLFFADRYSMKKLAGKSRHIRDPKPSQWKEHFTSSVQGYFEQEHGELIERYGYEQPTYLDRTPQHIQALVRPNLSSRL